MNTPFSFTLNDFMNLSNTQKAKVLEKYEKNNLPKQQMEIIKNFIDEVSIDFEKNNKTSYIDAVKDLSKLDEGINDLNNNLLRYQAKPEEIQKDNIKAEVKQVVNNINDKVSEKISELSSMEANDLLIEFDKIKNSADVSNFKPSNQKNEDDIFNITLFSELKKLKDSNNSEIGKKLNTIKEIKKDGDVITAISNDEDTNDFEKQFLTSAYTFLTEKNIDPATMSVVREKLYDNNAALLHEMFDEFFSYFSEISSSFQEAIDENPEIENNHILNNTIPQKYISNVPTPFTLEGNYMKLGEFEDLLSKLPDYTKEANSNKIKEDISNEEEKSSEELLNTINIETENISEDEIIIEDVIDPNESIIENKSNSDIEQKKIDIEKRRQEELNIFPESQVQETLYHNTTTDFEEFKTGKDGAIHFGDKEAARQRTKNSIADKKFTKEVRINIENLAEGVDSLDFDVPTNSTKEEKTIYFNLLKKADNETKEHVIALYKNGKITLEQANKLIDEGWSLQRIYKELFNADGYYYINQVENKGSKSYVVFNSNQIKVVNKINAKYDAELKQLESSINKNTVNPDKINISNSDVFAFDIDEKSEFY